MIHFERNLSHIWLALIAVVGIVFSPTTHAAFTQCPPIGQSPSCAVLITINPNGSLTFSVDPAIPPYDGVEDTLVGVLNNSGATIYGIALSGPDIFGFDGDGASGSSYAGPGTSFSITDANNGVVNFTNGLDDKQSLWFSLEGAPSQVKLAHTITIDPGHGGPKCPNGATGTTGPTYGDQERNLALSIGVELQTLLSANGDTVTMTRSTAGKCPTLPERAKIANDANTNIFVSIHLDGAGPSAEGTAVWYSPEALSSKQLATFTVSQLSTALGTGNNGPKANGIDCPWCAGQRGYLYVLDNTDMSAVLIEVAFLTNVGGDEDIMHASTAPATAAKGLFTGIESFFNQ